MGFDLMKHVKETILDPQVASGHLSQETADRFVEKNTTYIHYIATYLGQELCNADLHKVAFAMKEESPEARQAFTKLATLWIAIEKHL